MNDLLFIDQMIIKEVKMSNPNISMVWLDYNKAYDMVPHSWIIHFLETVGINEMIQRLLAESMKSWWIQLTSGEENLADVNIRRGIFQGDSLSPLLFVVFLLSLTQISRDVAPGYHFASNGQKVNNLIFMDDLKLYASNENSLESLIQTAHVFSNDMEMKSGVEKVLHSLETVGINEMIQRLLAESMKSWWIQLTSGEENLADVNIRRGIFQGDSLSPLLFVVFLLSLTQISRDVAPGYHFASNGQKVNNLLFIDDLKLYASNENSFKSLIQTVHVFSNDMGMKSGVENEQY